MTKKYQKVLLFCFLISNLFSSGFPKLEKLARGTRSNSFEFYTEICDDRCMKFEKEKEAK